MSIFKEYRAFKCIFMMMTELMEVKIPEVREPDHHLSDFDLFLICLPSVIHVIKFQSIYYLLLCL